MEYYKRNGIHVVEVPVTDFRVAMVDAPKKTAVGANYCNAGFFGVFREGKVSFTLPAGHLVCDFKTNSKIVERYCHERGTFRGPRFAFDAGTWRFGNQFYGKPLSTLIVAGSVARVEEIRRLPEDCDYAISGVPVMRGGKDVRFDPFVIGQGWDGSTLYATWHIFVGLKQDRKTVYVMGMKTTTGNLIRSAEAFRKFKDMGFREVIKLDGGGSFHLNVGGKTVQSTYGNRRINTILTFGGNPWPVPARPLKRGRRGNDVKWLQWELTERGFACGVDGSFGPATQTALMAYQTSVGLAPDGSCGPATRAALGVQK